MTYVAVSKVLIAQAGVTVEFLLVCWRWMGMQFAGVSGEVQEVVIFVAFFSFSSTCGRKGSVIG